MIFLMCIIVLERYIYKEKVTVFTSGSKKGGLLAREEECFTFNFMIF